MSQDPNPYQTISRRIAQIANHHARCVYAYNDAPNDLQELIDAATEAHPDGDPDLDVIRQEYADRYLAAELEALKTEASELGVILHPALIQALIPEVGHITEWTSSSYGC